MFAIRVEQFGGPEVMQGRELPDPVPKPGEVTVRLEAAGVNFIDTYQRTGRYPMPLPYTPGMEGAGVVEALGAGVTELRVWDRVGFAGVPGAYAERVAAQAEKLVPLPAEVTSEQAAAVLLQGMTAHFLTESTYPLRRGEWTLVHAGAGGVGLLLTQLARRKGARVITTVSTEEKAALSRAAGAEHVILYSREDVAARVRELTSGQGVAVVYDSVGKTTFDASLASLRPRGMLVLFGGASGPVPPVDPMVLSQKGSLFLTRPTLTHHTAQRAELLARARDVLGWVGTGELSLRIEHRYPLRDAVRAHQDLEGRKTTGKLVLLPGG